MKINRNSIVLRMIVMYLIPFTLFIIIVMVLNQNTKQRIQDEFILTNQNTFLQLANDVEENIRVAYDLNNVVTKNINLLEFIDNPNVSSESEFLQSYLNSVIPMIKYATAFTETNDYEIRIFMVNDAIPESWPYFFNMNQQNEHSQIKEFIADQSQTMIWLDSDSPPYLPKALISGRDQYTLVSKLYSSTRELLGLVTIMVAEDAIFSKVGDQPSQIRFASQLIMEAVNHEQKKHNNIGASSDNINTLTDLLEQVTDVEGYIMQDDYIYFYKTLPYMNDTLIYSVALHDLNKSLNKSSRYIVLAMLGSLIVFIVCCIFMFRLIFIRLNRMIAIMKKVVSGDMKMRIPDQRQDELGQLAQDMNELIESNNELIHNMIMKERLRKEAQIQALQYQINPHFIYNTLDVFRMRLIKEKMFGIADLLADFGKILRYNLSDQTHETTLGEELNMIRKYLNLQMISTSQQIKFLWSIDEKLHKYPVIKFLLQPIVENSIKYGKNSDKESIQITISSQIVNQDIYIKVHDNGAGIDSQKVNDMNEMFRQPILQYRENSLKSDSIGLQNINSRLRLYYGEQYYLVIDSEPKQYTSVTIKIPYQWEVETYGSNTIGR